jgi:GntR family transcriptional regulator
MIGEINKNIPTPLYYQLEQVIRQTIDSGALKPGESIPTELELMEQYQLSRATVRQAILQLVNDGYLRRQKSKGTIVKNPPSKVRFLGVLKSFSAEMSAKGIQHNSRIIEMAIISADLDVAAKLKILPGDQVFYLKRLRIVEEDPYVLDQHYIPYSLCPDIENRYFENTSLYHLLQTTYEINLHHGLLELEASGPDDEEEAKMMGVSMNTHLLFVERVVHNQDDIPVDYFQAKIRGTFSVNMLNAQEII